MHSTSLRRLGVIGAVAAATVPPLAARGQSAAPPEEIVVTGSLVPTPKREIGAAVTVIDATEIELRGYDGLADLLRTQVGIGVTNTGGAGQPTALRIRGEEGYRTQLIIDGVKAVDPSGTQVGPSFDNLLATGDMQRVEILRGPQGFIYGADAGGVVNVISARGAGPLGGRVSVEEGSFDTRRLNGSVSGGTQRGDYYVSVSDFATGGFNTQTADTVLRDRDGADNTTLHAKLGVNAGDDWRLQLVARAVDASAQYDGCFSPTTFATVHDCVATTDQTTYRLSADHAGARTTHSFGYSGIDIARDSLAEGVSAFATHGRLDRFEYTGSYRPVDGQTLVYGLDLEDERVTSDTRRQRNQNGYYVEYRGQLGAGVFLTAGARYDDSDDFGSYTSGRVSLAVARDVGSGSTLRYRASYGTGFRAPSLYEIAYDLGPFSYPPAAGLELAPEQNRGYDLGIDLDRSRGLHLEATLFDQRITDEIFFDLDTFSGYLASDGTSKSRGLELGAELPLGPRLRFLANMTVNDTADTTNQQRLRRPRRLGNIGVQYDGGNGLRFVLNSRFARDALDVGGVALPDYRVLDASFAYSWSKTFEVFGRIENATDTDYIEAIGFNTAGRSAYAGLRIKF
jgi:vitamin B12 transporter